MRRMVNLETGSAREVRKAGSTAAERVVGAGDRTGVGDVAGRPTLSGSKGGKTGKTIGATPEEGDIRSPKIAMYEGQEV